MANETPAPQCEDLGNKVGRARASQERP